MEWKVLYLVCISYHAGFYVCFVRIHSFLNIGTSGIEAKAGRSYRLLFEPNNIRKMFML